MKNKLTAEEEAYLAEFLNHGSELTAERLNLVRRWDSIPYDAPDPDHPRYTQRVTLLASYLNGPVPELWHGTAYKTCWVSFNGARNRSRKFYKYGLTPLP